MTLSDGEVARFAWAQLDQRTRAETLAAIREHEDAISPSLHARLMSTGLEARGFGGPDAQSFLVPIALKSYLQKIGRV